jgi:hypothetical protein
VFDNNKLIINIGVRTHFRKLLSECFDLNESVTNLLNKVTSF